MSGLLGAGFTLAGLHECAPRPELDDDAEFQRRLRIPLVLLSLAPGIQVRRSDLRPLVRPSSQQVGYRRAHAAHSGRWSSSRTSLSV